MPNPTRFTTLVDADALGKHLNDDDWLIVDCRFDLFDTEKGRNAWRQSHIPGAFYAHLDEQLSSPILPHTGRHPLPEPEALIAWLQACGLRNGMQVVAYDDSFGTQAARLWWLLRWLGHENVAVLDGGWQAWQAAGSAVDNAVPQAQNGDFQAVTDSVTRVTTDALSVEHDWLLIDARTAERYRGEQEPIDPVAGHVPGAKNLPLQENLAEDGRFLPKAALAEKYRQVIADVPVSQVACMCGSGVTACHNLLAMEHAGLHGAALYDGSWSEWIRDDSRPVATAV